MRRVIPKGLVFTVDLSKLTNRELPEGSEMTLDEYRRTVEAPISSALPQFQEPIFIEWGDGTTSIADSTATLPVTHTYAESGVYKVVMRSATGHLPYIRFSNGDSASATVPSYNLTLAVVSIDHFSGTIGSNSAGTGGALVRIATNLEYIDTRLSGNNKWSGIGLSHKNCPLNQPIGSFCFDFLTQCTNAEGAFIGCANIYGPIPKGFMDGLISVGVLSYFFNGCRNITGELPQDLLDKCISITALASIFSSCQGLTGRPYIFWKEDGSLDTDKFPNLTAATNAYAWCLTALRAQVPEAYGGTMTTS